MLFAFIPFVASAFVTWRNFRELFRSAAGRAPADWQWRLISPLLLSGLTPFTVAGRASGRTEWLLLLTAMGAALFTALIFLGVARDAESFFALYRKPALGAWRIRVSWRWVFFVLEIGLITFTAVATAVVAAD